jgi:hypothetical protein
VRAHSRLAMSAPFAAALLLAATGVGCNAQSEASTTSAPTTTTKDAPAASKSSGTPAPAPPASAGASSALNGLASLEIKGRAPKTGYSREQFGAAWSDVDHNGCDTRNDILNRDLIARSWRDGTHGCVVIAGTLDDPYTGKLIAFAKARAGAVQIDHVVALSDAWQTGAQGLDGAARLVFANDPLNLLAVDGPANESKGDGDAATWLPPNKSFRCRYVARQVAVKVRYGLWVTQAEHDAISGVLEVCPGEPAPSDGAVAPPVPAMTSVSPPPVSVPPVPPATAPPAPPATIYYANCTAARAAGATPLNRGDPGYRSALDRDGDGIACE